MMHTHTGRNTPDTDCLLKKLPMAQCGSAVDGKRVDDPCKQIIKTEHNKITSSNQTTAVKHLNRCVLVTWSHLTCSNILLCLCVAGLALGYSVPTIPNGVTRIPSVGEAPSHPSTRHPSVASTRLPSVGEESTHPLLVAEDAVRHTPPVSDVNND